MASDKVRLLWRAETWRIGRVKRALLVRRLFPPVSPLLLPRHHPPLLPTGLLPRQLPRRFPHVLGPLAVQPPHIAASKCAGEGGPKNRLEIGNPLPAARNMSFETIGQGEDGSSHFVVAGIAYPLLTRKEWKKRRRHGRGRRRRCGAHEITVLL